jgi:lysophospholipase L1-like esterase
MNKRIGNNIMNWTKFIRQKKNNSSLHIDRNQKNWFEKNPKKTLISITIIGVLITLMIGELLTRLFFSEINLQGTSRKLFVAHAFEDSPGNVKNGKAISFGTEIFTDNYGFRINPNYQDNHQNIENMRSIVLIGDSVTFGVGIKAEHIFPELLKQRLNQYRVFNTAVTGYSLEDYQNIVNLFVLPNKERFNIQHVILGFCLNDTIEASKRNIKILPTQEDWTLRYNFISRLLKHLNEYINFNNFLKSHSKLYLFVKSVTSDTSKGYFYADIAPYRDKEYVHLRLKLISNIKKVLEKNNISFTLLLLPYEYQLRDLKENNLYPQNIIREYSKENDVNFIDIYEYFSRYLKEKNMKSTSLYLFNDPMHFSQLGHKIVYEAIIKKYSF